MFILRPIQKKDLDNLLELLQDAGHGLTSLPKDKDILEQRITHSLRSFEHRVAHRPSGENYLFAMEDVETKKIVGVSGIISKIGGFEPYYFYRIKKQMLSSSMLKVKNEIRTLHIEAIHNGPTEICSLYLHPKFRNSQNGRFLSLSRFLFIADNRQYFENEVIAEMRGRVNDNGESPFWEAVGKNFFQIDFPTADYLSVKSKKFIDELLPRYPLIVNILPQEAQDVVEQVHDKTEPAKRILEQEGFGPSGLVGIFEPGPVLKADLDSVRTIRESTRDFVKEISKTPLAEPISIISVNEKHFAAALGPVEKVKTGGLRISEQTAQLLKLKKGQHIRYVSLKPLTT